MPPDPLDIEELLTAETSAENFAALVRRYARAAVSGAVPKFLSSHAGDAAATSLGKSSIRTGRHIIKGSDDRTPHLGFNEFYSLEVLKRLQVVPVADARMSVDGRLLIVDRFDLDEAGLPVCGLEDACSLLGLPPHEKYLPSMEEVLRATRAYLPAAAMRSSLEQLGWQILTNFVVRNADCHSKNIALYYTDLNDIAYTPAYDIVTTQAYPRFAQNPPGLSIEGRKTWAPGKSLEQFFKTRLGISPRDYTTMVDRLCESAVDTGRELIEAARNENRWRPVAKQMTRVWNEGMASLRSVKSETRFKKLLQRRSLRPALRIRYRPSRHQPSAGLNYWPGHARRRSASARGSLRHSFRARNPLISKGTGNNLMPAIVHPGAHPHTRLYRPVLARRSLLLGSFTRP